MTPQTRNSNKDANFKVYYAKKVPKQGYFPHRRKTVRRPDGVGKDVADKRQTRFLPDKMKIPRVNTVQDSDEEEGEDLEEGGVAINGQAGLEQKDDQRSHGKMPTNRGRKRRSDVLEAGNEAGDHSSVPSPKRRRKAAPNSTRRSRPLKAESEDDDDTTTASARGKVDRSRRLRRQSTMTQLVDGRRPLSDAEEPDFKPVKRSPRLSWGGQSKKAKDERQRTLTQMVPGMKPTEELSDADLEEEIADAKAEERESQAYGEAIAARLARGGSVQEEEDDATRADTEVPASLEGVSKTGSTNDHEADVNDQLLNVPSTVVHSFEHRIDEEDEGSYEPTQFIDAPVTRTRRSPRWASRKKQGVSPTVEASVTASRSTRKFKFGLLSTPEKRRIREIPSSQSPADSPLSTQVTPSKKDRSPLKERSNEVQGMDTPSKRRKVTFREPTKTPGPPPTLRKFKSTIKDSEDEDEDEDDELLETDENPNSGRVSAHTQALIHDIDNTAHGRNVGSETQAMLEQIDEACAYAHDDGYARELPEGLQESTRSIIQHDPSPELGERIRDHASNHAEESQDARPPYRSAHSGIKEEYWTDVEMLDLTTQNPTLQVDMPMAHDAGLADDSISTADEQVPSSPPIVQQQGGDARSSTHMVIMDSSDEEEDDINLTPPRKSTSCAPQPSSPAFQQSTDLDEQLVQVPRSPPAHHDTQQSHSSKAEQQLHNEWFSYSQYVNSRPPASSSMHVSHDKFSYHATPKPPRPLAPPQTSGHFMSQATTVDEVTPRKTRTQRTYSANTTPHKIASSQLAISPSKPPSLFIPSSFPSPTKARMEEWSSPVLGHTQMTYGGGGSLDDFSIPPLPPVEDDWMDG
ncbi:hypothetical protein HBI32_219150 [Parastagonospora nodorum]|nr:hypothetical protein HBI32_219150 [Parastagonospora nodorum]